MRVYRILAVAHSGQELYLPHKRDEAYYEDDKIVVSRLGCPSEDLRDTLGLVEARHAKDEQMQHLVESSLSVGDTVNALVRDVVGSGELSLSLLNSRLQGSKQTTLQNQSCFYLLGLQTAS